MAKKRIENPDLCEVGEMVQLFRTAGDISQQKLGDMIGTDGNTIYRYEAGAVEMGLSVFFKIAEAMEISPSMLFPRRFKEKMQIRFLDGKELEVLDNFLKLNPRDQDLVLWVEKFLVDYPRNAE